MGRKRKRNVPVETDTFTFSPAEVSASQAGSAHADIQHIEGGRTVRQMAVVAAPEEVVGRDFVDIRDLLGDTDDVRNLQNSEEVINQYIEGPGCQRRIKLSMGHTYLWVTAGRSSIKPAGNMTCGSWVPAPQVSQGCRSYIC